MDRACSQRSDWVASTNWGLNNRIVGRYHRSSCEWQMHDYKFVFCPDLPALKTSIMTSILGESTVNHLRLLRTQSLLTKTKGGLSTVVASYLARARGSNEPELSITRVKDLEQFLRECKAFSMDHGHTLGNECDAQLDGLRQRFEELLGNANG